MTFGIKTVVTECRNKLVSWHSVAAERGVGLLTTKKQRKKAKKESSSAFTKAFQYTMSGCLIISVKKQQSVTEIRACGRRLVRFGR